MNDIPEQPRPDDSPRDDTPQISGADELDAFLGSFEQPPAPASAVVPHQRCR